MSRADAIALKASVVIPVKNGGKLLDRVLAQLAAQRTPWPFDVLVVDSGSKDNSCAIARAHNVRVHQIPAAEFGHGKTRNLGASLTRGEFIVYITQDALPADEHWLSRLIEVAEASADCAGAFGRHLPYPEASPVTQHDLRHHFMMFGEQACQMRMDDPGRYRDDEAYRQRLHFFSSNNACIRRSVWQRIPLPDVDFSEDQLWAKSVIEAGYAKGYAPAACVYHSHDFGVFETYRRSFDESRAFHRLFGYRLLASVRQAAVHWRLLTRRDIGVIRAAPVNRLAKLRWALAAPCLNVAKLAGHYMGAKQSRLPIWVHELFSRDKALQKS